MFEKYLEDLGLSDKEAALYLALLSVDDAAVADLAKKTKIKRPTAYVVLEGLAKKGLVSEVAIGNKTHFRAEPPERLQTFVERRKIALTEQEKRLVDIIPQLKSMQRETGEKPVVRYFEGKEGIVSSLEELLGSYGKGEEISYLIYSRDLVEENFSPEDLDRFRKIRIGSDVKSKSIYTYSKGAYNPDQTGTRLRVDEKKYPIDCDISTYKDSVRINILGKRLGGILIRSQELADTIKSLVNLVFDLQEKNKDGA